MRAPVARPGREPAALRLVTPSATSPAPDLNGRQYAVAVAIALALGFAIRAVFVLPAGFPLNDGGMFYAMVRDIQANGYRLPAYTSYNGGHLPFAYPPLAFYIAAVVDRLTPMSLLTTFRVLPLAFSTLLLVAFFLLARDMFASRLATAVAVFFFAALPDTFSWMIMGGGLTRSLGFVFALLFIREVRRVYLAPSRRGVAIAGLFAALCILSHIEMAVLACVSGGLFFLAYGRSRRGVVDSLAVIGVTLAIVAPWLALVIVHNGVSPFVASLGSTQSAPLKPIVALLPWRISGESGFALIGALALLGALISLARREFLLPGWILAVVVFDQRAYVTSSSIALAMLASVAVVEFILPLASGRSALTPGGERRPNAILPIGVVTIGALFCLASAIAVTPGLLSPLSGDERAAMAWASQNTDPAATFAVISGRTWPQDRNGEWFPVLADRHEAVVVQGTEWLPGRAFQHAIKDYADLQACANSTGDCLEAQMTASGKPFDYVYVTTLPPGDKRLLAGLNTCCDGLRAALRSDPRYQLVYDGPGATIFRRKS